MCAAPPAATGTGRPGQHEDAGEAPQSRFGIREKDAVTNGLDCMIFGDFQRQLRNQIQSCATASSTLDGLRLMLFVLCAPNPADGCAGFACANHSSPAPDPRSPAISPRRRELPRRWPRRDRVSSRCFWRRHESRPACFRANRQRGRTVAGSWPSLYRRS